MLGAEQNSTRETMKDVISFEVELASIIESDEARRDEDKNYHRMTIAELQNIAPFVSIIRDFHNLNNFYVLILTYFFIFKKAGSHQ